MCMPIAWLIRKLIKGWSLERGLQIDSNDVESIGRWVVDDKTFHSLVEAGDKTGLNRHLQPLINTSIVDFILVTDSEGNVLTWLVAERAE